MTLGEMEQAALKLSRSDRTQLYTFLRSIMSDTSEFRVGNSVKFTSRRGVCIKGKITKVNRKTVKVASKQDRSGNILNHDITWTVSPQLLEKV